ncbi:MAG: phosphoribosylamine--glycine ligase [Bacteroidetes bacterium]|nr:MAG: phosphoribosylamine--glycine ligase [Bacteroidota bacterium]
MRVLVLGSGGREHAMSWKISQSNLLEKLFIAPGNAGTAELGENINLNPEDFPSLKSFCLEQKIQLVVVGPEAPLVAGVVDYFKNDFELKNIGIIGPDKVASQLEGSKKFAKEFMAQHQIPTAAYRSFSSGDEAEAKAFLSTLKAPYVLKADGLAAGKGVLIIDNLAEAQEEIDAMLGGKFGDASKTLVIEEFLAGLEFSVFVLTDGKSYKVLPVAKDYKRIGEGDTGPNTGGMGAVSPVSFVDNTMMEKVIGRIVEPTVKGLNKADFTYVGFVFIGLIEVQGEPMVIEYNVRMGDPETEVVMPRIKSDFLQHLKATAEGRLAEENLEISEEFATTVMAVSEGYPGAYPKGKEISGLDKLKEVLAFHAGTKLLEDKIVTNGGRVIAISALGSSKEEALSRSYAGIKAICYEGIEYRKDIGFDL